MTKDEIGQIVRALMPGLEEHIARIVDPIIAEQKSLRETLEHRLLMKYCGVWEQGRSYMRGDVCTRSGCLWLALDVPHGGTPGKSTEWRLIAKGEAR